MKSRTKTAAWLFFTVALIVAVSVFGRALMVARAHARDANSRGRLSQIGLALHNYRADYGQLPNVVFREAAGIGIHSWRAAVAAHLARVSRPVAILSKYDFAQPWDSTVNLQLARAATPSEYGEMFRSPQDLRPNHQTTSYVAVTGPDTAWELSDDALRASTPRIMVLEIYDSDIHWMEPRDITVGDIAAGRYKCPTSKKINYLLSDGAVGAIGRNSGNRDLLEMIWGSGQPAQIDGEKP